MARPWQIYVYDQLLVNSISCHIHTRWGVSHFWLREENNDDEEEYDNNCDNNHDDGDNNDGADDDGVVVDDDVDDDDGWPSPCHNQQRR